MLHILVVRHCRAHVHGAGAVAASRAHLATTNKDGWLVHKSRRRVCPIKGARSSSVETRVAIRQVLRLVRGLDGRTSRGCLLATDFHVFKAGVHRATHRMKVLGQTSAVIVFLGRGLALADHAVGAKAAHVLQLSVGAGELLGELDLRGTALTHAVAVSLELLWVIHETLLHRNVTVGAIQRVCVLEHVGVTRDKVSQTRIARRVLN